ncbi:hypothetical protein BDZ89DRAFT_1065682 [Hymenopellis radicata]|nr:hypothetical protein BDZ89DRAFT_1065682 [Hymenopellis radicata]
MSEMTWDTSFTPHKPARSSPLASDASSPTSPTFSSPLVAAQSRRRSQYKSRVPSLCHRPTPPSSSSPRTPGCLFQTFAKATDDPEKDMMRHKFQTRCFKRAAQARQNAVKQKRYQECPNSDPFGEDDDMDDDFDENDDWAMSDELYRRIVAHANSKLTRSYAKTNNSRLGCPVTELEDVDAWESELQEDCDESVPDDQEFAELEAYVQEYENQVASSSYDHASGDDFDWDDLSQNDLDAMDLS